MNLSRQRLRRQKLSSSSLIVVLFAVVLATVIILAILTGAQVERQTSFYYQERIRADAIAQSGLEQAIGLLRTGMGSVDQSWISGPGRMVTITYNANGGPTYSPINLYSGTNATVPGGVYAPPNLNSQKLDTTYPIDGDTTAGAAGIPLQVAWIYIRQDGTLDTSDTPAVSAANPLVGRYAFWVDDSSSRINLNTAWSRGATNTCLSRGDVSRINLATVKNATAGTAFPADETHNISSTNLFNSDDDLRANDIVTDVSANRYLYTAYNHSSDGLNPFGKPKIYLTTQSADLPAGFTNVPGYTNDYFDILANDTGNQTNSANDPGVASNLSDTRISAVVNNLYSSLTNTAWPEAPGTSFAKKYWGSNTDPRIFQLALNMVEYVRAKESQQKIVDALRGYVSNGTFVSTTVANLGATSPFNPGSTGAATNSGTVSMPMIGVTRTPLLTEMGAFWDSARPGWVVLQAEIYLPLNVGIDSLNAGDFCMPRKFYATNAVFTPGSVANGYGNNGYWPVYDGNGGAPVASASGEPANDFYAIGPGSFPLTAGKYIQVQCAQGTAYTTNSVATVYCAYCLGTSSTANNSTGNRVSTCATLDWGGNWNNVTFGQGPGTINPAAMVGPFYLTAASTSPAATSMQVDDPLLGHLAGNWHSAPSTWGAVNSGVRTVGQSPAGGLPPQDTDSSHLLTDVGWRLPYPYLYTNASGAVPNPTGRMDSLAELGYVNTGAVDWSSADGKNGVPWRTLRFQPSSSVTLPDWALLDLFALPPSSSTNFAYQPYSWTNTPNTYGASGGRLNLNGLLNPFTNVIRAQPLMALLSGATNPITGDTNYMTINAGALATNILNMQLAAQGQPYDSTNGLYAHIGELAELGGMADTGESSEGNLFEPFAQTTVSGNVFTVYTIGQALRQTPSGSIVVNGEKRYQATIERIPTIPASAASGLFRLIGVRELTP